METNVVKGKSIVIRRLINVHQYLKDQFAHLIEIVVQFVVLKVNFAVLLLEGWILWNVCPEFVHQIGNVMKSVAKQTKFVYLKMEEGKQKCILQISISKPYFSVIARLNLKSVTWTYIVNQWLNTAIKAANILNYIKENPKIVSVHYYVTSPRPQF